MHRLFQYVMWPLSALWTVLIQRPDMVYLGEYNPAGIGIFPAPYLGLLRYISLNA